MLQEHFDGKSVIDPLTAPERDRGMLVDSQSAISVGRLELPPVRREPARIGSRTVEGASVGPNEPQCAAIEHLDQDAALMDLPMMESAQGN